MFGQGPRTRVHSPEYLGFLAEAWDAWSALGDAGPEMIANIHPVRHAATYPTHIVGRLGWHTADTACPIGPGTFAAACAATDVATTAAQMVLDGEDAVYALCRPPGHHAFRDVAGGFCFLNNSAIAAAHLRLKHERVAILDVDVHHGNGTQGIFYERRRRADRVDPCRSRVLLSVSSGAMPMSAARAQASAPISTFPCRSAPAMTAISHALDVARKSDPRLRARRARRRARP